MTHPHEPLNMVDATGYANTGNNNNNKPVGNWISAPSLNFVAMATRVGPMHNILHGSVKSAIHENPLVGSDISGLFAIQANL